MPNEDGTPTSREKFYDAQQHHDLDAVIHINGRELAGDEYWIHIGQWLKKDSGRTLVEYKITTGYKGAPMPYNGEYIAIAFWLENQERGFQTFLYCLKSETWKEYDTRTSKWDTITDKEMNVEIGEFVKQKHILGSSRSAATITSYRSFMETWLPYRSKQPFVNLQNRDIIPFQNTAYNWREGKFQDAQIYDFIFSNIPHEYHAKAICPMIKTFLTHCTEQEQPKKDLFIHSIMGFSSSLLQGYNLNQWILMLISQQGGVGKGTFMKLISHVLGRDNVIEVSDKILSNPAAIDCIIGKRLIVMSETGDDLECLPIIKRISGGDTVPMNPKYKPSMDYEPIGQIAILSNNKVNLDPKEVAYWRRPMLANMIDAPFWTLEEYDANLEVMLSEPEIQGFLALLIKYIARQKEIKRKYHKLLNAENIWSVSIVNTEYEFFDDCIKVDGSNRIKASVLVEKYKEWMKIHDIKLSVEQKKEMYVRKFNKMLGAWCRGKRMKDALKVRGNACIVWTGIMYDDTNIAHVVNDQIAAKEKQDAAKEDPH